mgnify:CR=1 FL=1
MSQTLPPGLDEDEAEPPEPPRLRFLRRLVTALTLVLILGMTAVAGTLVWRLSGLAAGGGGAAPSGVAAEALSLPAGARVIALGGAGGEVLVLVETAEGGEALLAYDRADGRLLSRTEVRRSGP